MIPLRQTMPVRVMKPTQWATESTVAWSQTSGSFHPDAAASSSGLGQFTNSSVICERMPDIMWSRRYEMGWPGSL